jgi:two-component system OmpR family response regulator
MHERRQGGHVPNEIAATRRILIMHDDAQFGDSLATVFGYEGYEVEAVPCGQLDRSVVNRGSFDLMVVAILRPGSRDLDIISRVGSGPKRVPMLYVLGEVDQRDRIAPTTDNGEHHLVGSSSLEEIVGRANTLLSPLEPSSDRRPLRYADLVMDEVSHLVWRAGAPIHLSPIEFDLLRLFLTFPLHVLSKEQILEEVWHYDFDGNAKVVETYVRYLRRKLDPLGAPLIQTVRLVGYVLREA